MKRAGCNDHSAKNGHLALGRRRLMHCIYAQSSTIERHARPTHCHTSCFASGSSRFGQRRGPQAPANEASAYLASRKPRNSPPIPCIPCTSAGSRYADQLVICLHEAGRRGGNVMPLRRVKVDQNTKGIQIVRIRQQCQNPSYIGYGYQKLILIALINVSSST